ncbi:hypothetical protein ACWEFL_09600 [Streptomyces sp. NPDC004838]
MDLHHFDPARLSLVPPPPADTPATGVSQAPLPEGFDYYAGAGEVARSLQEAGLTPYPEERRGSWADAFCTVEAIHPDAWPDGALLCVEVVCQPPREYRGLSADQDPPGAAAYRREQLTRVTETLRGLGYGVEVIERDGMPGRQSLRVRRPG